MTDWHFDIQPWCDRVDAAADRLFTGSDWQLRIRAITGALRGDVQRLVERGADGTPTLVIIGSLGEGKSWLARCFLDSHPDNAALLGELRSGQNHEDRTQSVTWFGPAAPPGLNGTASSPTATNAGLSKTNERFWLVPESRLINLGRPYVVADTPGHSDIDSFRRNLSTAVGSAATIKLLVCSFAQVRDGGLARWIAELDGSVILPVIRFRPPRATTSRDSSSTTDADAAMPITGEPLSVPGEPTATQRADVQRELAQWRQLAPQIQWLEPCFMPDHDLYGDQAARELVQSRLGRILTPALGQVAQLREATERQIRHRWQVAQQQLATLLQPFRQRVLAPIEQLESLTHHLPERLLAELVGGDDELRLALRPRLRADWIERTPAICFPYRSLLGLLALTAGAWDRLALSLMGSLPSLVLTAVQAARNATDFKQASQRLRAGLTERVERLLRDEFRGAIRQFRAAVIASLPRETLTESLTSESSSWGATASGEMDEVRILGLDGAEADSRRIMQEVVRERRAATSTVLLFAGLATLSFVFLLTGPLVALYRAYLGAHHNAFLAAGTKWTDFPAPTASMLLASLVLSVLPVFALALVALTWCCRAARIRAAADDIQQQHRQALQQRFESGALRIELTDQQLDAARLLLAMTTRSS